MQLKEEQISSNWEHDRRHLIGYGAKCEILVFAHGKQDAHPLAVISADYASGRKRKQLIRVAITS